MKNTLFNYQKFDVFSIGFVQFFRQGVSSYTDGNVWDGSKDSSYFCSDIF